MGTIEIESWVIWEHLVAGSNPISMISYSSNSQLIYDSHKLLLHAKLTQKLFGKLMSINEIKLIFIKVEG